MIGPAFEHFVGLSSEKSELEASVEYLSRFLSQFIQKGESVVIAFSRENENDLGSILEKAVLCCGGKPLFWEKDLRWITLLKISFTSKAAAIIAPPLIILGLTKIAAYQNMPLYFQNCVTAGYPCMSWMMDGIEKGLDCKIWGIMGPGTKAIVSGVSCKCGRGVHIRDDLYSADILDCNGEILPIGEYGRIQISRNSLFAEPLLCNVYGRIQNRPCECGRKTTKIIEIDTGPQEDNSSLKIAEQLLFWDSILECDISRSEYGLEMEIICLRGKPLPHLPSCAKLIIRPWDPNTDIPLCIERNWS